MKNYRAIFAFLLLFSPIWILAPARDFLWRASLVEWLGPHREALQKSSDWRDQLAGAALPISQLWLDEYSIPENWNEQQSQNSDSTISPLEMARRNPRNLALCAYVLKSHHIVHGRTAMPTVQYNAAAPYFRNPLGEKARKHAQTLLQIARNGAKFDAQNAFWDWREAHVLLILRRDDDAIAALERAVKKPRYFDFSDEFTAIDARKIWPAPDSARSILSAVRLDSSDAISRQTNDWFAEIVAVSRERNEHPKARKISENLLEMWSLRRKFVRSKRLLNQLAYSSASHFFPTVQKTTSESDGAPAPLGAGGPPAGVPFAPPFPTPTPDWKTTRPKPSDSVAHFRAYEKSLAFYARPQNDLKLARRAENAWQTAQTDRKKVAALHEKEAQDGSWRAVSNAHWNAALWPEWLARRWLPLAWPFVALGFVALFWRGGEKSRFVWSGAGVFLLVFAGVVGLTLWNLRGYLYGDYRNRVGEWMFEAMVLYRVIAPEPFWWPLLAVFLGAAIVLGWQLRAPKPLAHTLFFPIVWLVNLPIRFWQFARCAWNDFLLVAESLRGHSTREFQVNPKIDERPGFWDSLFWPGTVTAIFFFGFGGLSEIAAVWDIAPTHVTRKWVLPAVAVCSFGYLLAWQIARLLRRPNRAQNLRNAISMLRDFVKGGAFAALTLFWLFFALDFYGQRAFQTAWRDVQTRGELAVLAAQTRENSSLSP